MKMYGKWFYLGGMLLAVLAALFSFQATWLSLIFLLLGILAAVFYFDSDDIVNFGLRFLIFAAVKDVFGGIPFIGSYLTTIFGAVFAFVAPVVFTTLIIWFVKKYFMAKK